MNSTESQADKILTNKHINDVFTLRTLTGQQLLRLKASDHLMNPTRTHLTAPAMITQ